VRASFLSHAPYRNIRHAFFTRAGGVSEGIYASLNGGIGSRDAPDKVRENRARMAASLGVAPDHLVSCYQIHSPDVIVAETPWTRETAPHADAIVTKVAGLAIGVSTADCGPILFADAQAGVIGAAHAGWKGALTGVLEATVAAMEKLGAARKCRGSLPLHLCRPGTLLQLPSHHPSRRARLWPPCECNCADEISPLDRLAVWR